MRSYLRLKYQTGRKLPAEFREAELRYPEELVATFIQRFTRPSDVVLDPFAGYGTTLLVAEALGREAYGVEIDARRAAYIRGRIQNPERILHGDARALASHLLPKAKLVMSAPPFMAIHEQENVLRGSRSARAYAEYLDDLAQIYALVAQQLAPQGQVVIEVSNLKDEIGVTPLAWDVARAVSQVLHFVGETVITWDRQLYGYDHSYCLLFTTNDQLPTTNV